MSRLSTLERQVLQHAGCAAADVAAVLGVGVRRVELARERCGYAASDGLPLAPQTQPAVDFDRLMRSNRGVCG